MNRKDEIVARIRAIKAERTSLSERLAQASASADRFRALAEMTLWAELDSGASIKVGSRVRYLLKIYECTTAHTKALTRRPTNTEYWQEVENT